jgi:flagellin-like hook-associated protein FlgL
MASGILLSAGVRQNLLSLQTTATLTATTQNRLATGKKVNSALDNPSSFFTSSSLQSRAGDLSALLDGMANGIQTLQAASNGLSSITTTVQSMQSTLRQARQDKSFQSVSFDLSASIGTTTAKSLSFSGGSIGTAPVTVALNSLATTATSATLTGTGGFTGAGATLGGAPAAITIQAANLNGGTAVTVNTLAAGDTAAAAATKINAALTAATGGAAGITADGSSGQLVFTSTSGNNVTLGGDDATLTSAGFATANRASTNGVLATAASVKTVDQLVSAINSNASLIGKVTATNDGGKLRLQNLSTSDLSVGGATGSTVDGSAPSTSSPKIVGNDTRKSLVNQYNDLKDQLDKFVDDASYNGTNLLRGDKLKLTFNETGTSTISIQAKTKSGAATSIDSAFLGIATLQNSDFDSDTNIDSLLDTLGTALNTLRSQSSSFGSSLTVVQNRQDFTKQMVNTLQVGADGLVLADTNEEGANMLALQTRQQLSTTALSLANQANQAVLRLFG